MPPVRRMRYVRPVPYGNQARRAAVKVKQDAAVVARALVRGSVPSASLSRGYERRSGYYGRFTGPNAENKFFDTALTFDVDTTGEVPATGQLVLIPQGVTESTRVGRKCVIKSVHMRGNLNFVPGAAQFASSNIKICLVLDKQCNGAAAAITDVLSANTVTTAFVNLANSERFVILKSFVYSFNPAAGVQTAFNTVSQRIEFYKKCNIPIEYSSTTGAITEIRSNNLFLIAGGDGNSDDLVQVRANCRVRFSD